MFERVPKENLLKIWHEDKTLDVKKLMDLLGIDRRYLADWVKIKADSVRFDDRMPVAIRNNSYRLAYICELVARVFDGDSQKVALWMRIDNPNFGGVSPLFLVKTGKIEKLESMVAEATAQQTVPQTVRHEK